MKSRVVTPDKKYSYIAKALIALAMYFSFQGCQSDMQAIGELQELKEAVFTMYDVDMVHTDSGMLQVRMRAPIMERFDFDNNPYMEFPEGIDIESYGRDSTIRGKVTAKYAIHYEKTDLWEGRGDVVAVNSVGDRLNTEILFWDAKEQKIYTHVVARVTQIGKAVLIGLKGMESYMEENGDFRSFFFYKSEGGFVKSKEKAPKDSLSF